MKNKILSLSILIFSIIFSGILITSVLAQSAENNLQYPIAELGNCRDKIDCKTFCDKTENQTICLNFAEKNNLMNQEELDNAKKFITIKNGPGGCTSKDSCEAYCEDINYIEECTAFAEVNGFLSQDKLDEAKKISAALKRGVKAPTCKTEKTCDTYCKDSAHMEECITFAKETGTMQGKELEDADKMLQAIKRGIKPPACNGQEECDVYCSSVEHMEECMTFAMEAGFMSEEEKANSDKMLQAVRKGIKPPSCKGSECDVYCASEEHFEECMNFSIAAGMMGEKDAAMMRKTGGKGPGGCRGKECDAFCNNPDNQETCFNFAKENKMIPEEDLKRMEEGKQEFSKMFNNMSQEVQSCIVSKLGVEMVEKIKSGQGMPSRDSGDQIQQCFDTIMGKPGQNQGMSGPNLSQEVKNCLQEIFGVDAVGRWQSGNMKDEEMSIFSEKAKTCFDKFGAPGSQPGNCQGSDCINNNQNQMNQQNNSQPCQGDNCPIPNNQQGMGINGQFNQPTGSGGCTTPESCGVYCSTHVEECKNFGTSNNQIMPQITCTDNNCPSAQQGQGMMTPKQQICEGSNCLEPQPKCTGENCQGGQRPFQSMYPSLDQQPGQSGQPGQYIQGSPGMAPCVGDNCQQFMQNLEKQIYQQIQNNISVPCEGSNCQSIPPQVQQYIEGQQQPPQGGQQMMPILEEQTPPTSSSFLSKIFGSVVNDTKSLFELFLDLF